MVVVGGGGGGGNTSINTYKGIREEEEEASWI